MIQEARYVESQNNNINIHVHNHQAMLVAFDVK